MKVLLRCKLEDGRSVLVYDDGRERNNLVLLVSFESPMPNKVKKLKNSWNWEEKVPEILGVSKEELGLK